MRWALLLACACGSTPAMPGSDAEAMDSPDDSSSAMDAPTDSGIDAAPMKCALADSAPIVAASDGQVIEKLKIVAKGKPGIDIAGKKNVVVRNVWILHEGAAGIRLANAGGAKIENVVIEHTGAPSSGANASADRNNIDCLSSPGISVTGARLTRGSSGIYMNQCPTATLKQLEGHDFRGPFPRGQLAQWDASDDGVLDGFSVVNGHTSWTEDNVNVYKSKNVIVRNGLVDGNNSPSGVGVIFDGDTGAGLVEDVDAVHMGNGCFSNIAGQDGNTFRRVRCRDNICTSQDGRGAPLSNALMFCGKPNGSLTKLEQSQWFASCNGNISWPNPSFATLDLSQVNFVPRAPLALPFCWE